MRDLFSQQGLPSVSRRLSSSIEPFSLRACMNLLCEHEAKSRVCGCRKSYLTDVSDQEWSFAADQHAPQRKHDLRLVFNALRGLVRAGLLGGLCPTICRPGRRSISRAAGGWMRTASRRWSRICAPSSAWPKGARGQPSAVVMDGRTLQSSCESDPRAAYDGYKRQRGSKVHGRGHAGLPAGSACHACKR